MRHLAPLLHQLPPRSYYTANQQAAAGVLPQHCCLCAGRSQVWLLLQQPADACQG
jgi:hypothetical protein